MTGFEIGLLAYTGALSLPGFFCLWRVPRCPAARLHADARRVSVIVPARNEERRITPLLESLARQSRRADEILVVDDDSTDGTAATAQKLGARVIAAPTRPDGWIGKSWACWTGARTATGTLLVFLDADVRLEDEGLARILAAHAETGGFVSVQPYHEVPRAYERLSAICNVVIMGSLGAFTPLGERLRSVGGFGPCIAVARADYFSFGGHSTVRDEVVEDLALGDTARRYGLPVACFGGRGSVNFRMYPEGIRSLVEGWSRGMSIGAGKSPPLARALMVAWIIGVTTSVITCGMGIASLAGGAADGSFGMPAVGLYCLYAAQLFWILRRIGGFGCLTALLFPLPLVFFHMIFAHSIWISKIRGSVTWRGRRIDVRMPRSTRGRSPADASASSCAQLSQTTPHGLRKRE